MDKWFLGLAALWALLIGVGVFVAPALIVNTDGLCEEMRRIDIGCMD